MQSSGSITDVPNISVGHATDQVGLTGCTVVLCEDGAVGGVDQRGGAPGTRETDLLRPLHLVQHVHAVLLAGGSAFGLAAAEGVVQYLAERGIGFDTGVARVPIVPAAILFDLGVGDPSAYPTAEMGYTACLAANQEPVSEGNIGAGTGASAGKVLGIAQAMKSGLGTAAVFLDRGIVVGALVAANPLGDIVNPSTGEILAGTRRPGSLEVLGSFTAMQNIAFGNPHMAFGAPNTVIGVVATNAQLTKEEANFVAQMAQDGIARAIRPAHTLYDGDTVFALATGTSGRRVDVSTLGACAAEALATAIQRAAYTAESAAGLPAYRDLLRRETTL